MNIGIFGTGVVGRTLAAKLNTKGHDVMIGTRVVEATMARPAATGSSARPFSEWLKDNPSIALGTFEQTSAYGEVIINATKGTGAIDAVGISARADLEGKILIDLSNPLDYSNGFPPSLFVCNTDSLAEQIQRALPHVRVVKTLNVVNCNVMADPAALVDGEHQMMVCGNDPTARAAVAGYLKEWFGWKEVIDIGNLTGARAMEMMLPMWLHLYKAFGTTSIGWNIVRPKTSE